MAENSRAGRSRRRRARNRRVAAGGLGLAIVVGGGAAAVAATSGGGSARRVATASVASVTQTVESSGTIASSRKSAPAFSVPGTVSSVAVKVGDKVSTGQLLARLDTSSLRTAVDSAATTLATANQQLEADKTGQTSTGQNGGSAGSRVTTSSYQTGSFSITEVDAVTPTSAHSGGSLADVVKQIVSAQNAVITGQKKVDTTQHAIDTAQKTVNADIVQNTKFRDAQQTACTAAEQSEVDSSADSTSQTAPTVSAMPSATPSDVPTASTAPTASPTETPPPTTPPVSAACTSAMADYEAFAGTMSTDTAVLSGKISAQDGYLTTLQTAMKKLDRLVGTLQAAASNSGSGGAGGNGPTTGPKSGGGSGKSGQGQSGSTNGDTGKSGSGRSGSGQSGSGQSGSGQSGSGRSGSGTSGKTQGQDQTGGSSSGVPASAAQLAADQAAIDSASAQLGVAQQNLTAATLTSPMAGTVAAVGLTAGTSSSSGTITIVGSGAQEADVAVPLGEIDQVKVGQSATLAADGVTGKIHGTVRSVGLLSSTSGSSTTFPVTIDLDAASPALFDGSGADVVITTATAHGAVTVPNSAVHTSVGNRHSVTVVDGAKTTTVPVTVGIADSDRTQILSGLKAGQQVVLADFSQPLPDSSTSSNTGGARFAGGGGGFGFRGAGGGRAGR